MKTKHKIIYKTSSEMKEVLSESVNLVVTSPPYPMIEMWDLQFSTLNIEIKDALQKGDGMRAYSSMHEELNKVWKEVDRVLVPGSIVCINIGDATRKLGDSFQLYANHSRITYYFEKMGYQVLPSIIWRKETNKPNKFMGSGMLPPNAYVTLEHEYILIFRKGKRDFDTVEKQNRHKSAYFWEERNVWFSDIWNNLKGITQKLNHENLRDRSAAYPFELAFRLINMYSTQGDIVLDPFFGTGTTMLAAMCSARNSMGYEIDPNFIKTIDYRLDNEFLRFSKEIVIKRLRSHIEFVEKRQTDKGELKHKSLKYGFMVMTNQEKNISFPLMEKIDKINENEFEVSYNEEIPEQIIKIEAQKSPLQNKLMSTVNLSNFIQSDTDL